MLFMYTLFHELQLCTRSYTRVLALFLSCPLCALLWSLRYEIKRED